MPRQNYFYREDATSIFGVRGASVGLKNEVPQGVRELLPRCYQDRIDSYEARVCPRRESPS